MSGVARVALATDARSTMPFVASWTDTIHTLSSVDGSKEFVVSEAGLDHGVFITRGGLTGMGIPTLTRWVNDSPATNGATFQGLKVGVRDVQMPLFIWHVGGTIPYLEWERSFFGLLDPTQIVYWTVTTPLTERRLAMRLVDDGGYAETMGASRFGWERYVLHFVAEDQPMWVATDTQPAQWSASNVTPFFGGSVDGFGPPFYLTSAQRIGEQMTVTNRGDVDAWPIWTITTEDDPVTSLTVTVGNVAIALNTTIPANSSAVIDCRPSSRGLFDAHGRFIPGGLKQARFGAIPPGVDTALSMTINSEASDATVSATFEELYYRAR